MEKIAISKFKATCLEVLDRVGRTGCRIQITRFGHPVAEIGPPSPRPGWLGCMRGTARIEGDLVAPAAEEGAWEVLGS